MLILDDPAEAGFPDGAEPPVPLVGPAVLAGDLDGRPVRAARAAGDAAPAGATWIGLRSLHARTRDAAFRMAGRALQLLEWDETHRWCGRCGRPTVTGDASHVRTCSDCGLAHFPRLAPAVIVSVVDGDRILLARSPGLPKGIYSVLAGFVEPGETLEEAVEREVFEETRIRVGDVQYFGSQPWPFPHSLMVGFTARYASGTLAPDPAELEDAGWYDVDTLPTVSPRISIARALIDAFIASTGRDPSLLGD